MWLAFTCCPTSSAPQYQESKHEGPEARHNKPFWLLYRLFALPSELLDSFPSSPRAIRKVKSENRLCGVSRHLRHHDPFRRPVDNTGLHLELQGPSNFPALEGILWLEHLACSGPATLFSDSEVDPFLTRSSLRVV